MIRKGKQPTGFPCSSAESELVDAVMVTFRCHWINSFRSPQIRGNVNGIQQFLGIAGHKNSPTNRALHLCFLVETKSIGISVK